MASDRTILAVFTVFRGAGLPFPSDPIVAEAMPTAWRITLEHVSDADLMSAVRRYLQSDPPPVWWPKAGEIAALARLEGCGRLTERPDFSTLRRAYFEARSNGSHDVAARLPDGVRDAILAKLNAVGGMPALRRAMMAWGSKEIDELEAAFNSAPGAALVRMGDG